MILCKALIVFTNFSMLSTYKTNFMIKAINNELMKNQNIKIDITVLGRLCFKSYVSLKLVKETINSISVFGVLKAPEEIKTYFNKK